MSNNITTTETLKAAADEADDKPAKGVKMTGPAGTKVTVSPEAVDFMKMAGYK